LIGKKFALKPTTPQQIMDKHLQKKYKIGPASKGGEEQNKLSAICNSVSENHKPNLREKMKGEGEHLVLLTTKSELREVRNNPDQVFFVLVCKDILISPNDILLFLVLCLIFCRTMKMFFQKKHRLDYLLFEELSIKLISFPRAALPNRPPYRTNPEEMKEIQRQVQELDNG
jgi:hypothetical protein